MNQMKKKREKGEKKREQLTRTVQRQLNSSNTPFLPVKLKLTHEFGWENKKGIRAVAANICQYTNTFFHFHRDKSISFVQFEKLRENWWLYSTLFRIIVFNGLSYRIEIVSIGNNDNLLIFVEISTWKLIRN